MIRGTTPTHIFTIPFEVELIADLRISYAQEGSELFAKKIEDVILENNTISVNLTQEETLKFDCTQKLMIQIKVKTRDGKVMSSDIMNLSVKRCLNNEVL